MPAKKPTSKRKTTTTRKKKSQRVIVEMRRSVGLEAAATFSMAAEMGVPGLALDTDYEPVEVGTHAQPELTASLESTGDETVFMRGTTDDMSALRAYEKDPENNVVSVWLDTEIAPFGAVAEEDPVFVEAQTTAMAGPCPCPPCDCSPGTAKGDIPAVAKHLGVDKIWAAGCKGQGITIGIVDGGITAQGRTINPNDINHIPNQSCPRRWPNKLIPRVIGGWPTANWGTTGVAWCWHGNMTATDALGMAPQAQVYDIRISGAANIPGTISNALAGFQWAINQHKAGKGPHILSNSWGIFQRSWDPAYATNPNHPFTRKVVEAIQEGILVLFAAGNCGQTCPSGRCGSDNGPGKDIWGANGHPLVMTVGAANIKDEWIGYSSQGPAALNAHKPDFCGISHFKGFFASDTGTSAACPVAAGVVALLKQGKPSLTQAAAKTALKQTAKQICGGPGWNANSGSGTVQAKAAFDKIGGKCKGDGDGDKPDCKKYADAAKRYLALYRRTRKRKYLCQYYRYLAAYYCCLYKRTGKKKYLCRCRRYQACYFWCLYKHTRKKKYRCLYYQYQASRYCCLYQVFKRRRYRVLCRRYFARYKNCK